MTFTRKMLVAALTVTTLAMGALATAGDASAKGFKGGGGGFKGGFHGHKHGHFHKGHGHRGHGHRWYGSHYAGLYSYTETCYFARKPSGLLVRICPEYWD